MIWRKRNSKPATGSRATSTSRLLVGALLILSCGTAAVLVTASLDDRQPVLAVARAVPVGQPLTAQDLRQVRVAVDDGVSVIGVDLTASVVGRPAAVSLSAGALLTQEVLGGAAIPAGQAVVAVPLAPGRLPAGVAVGARVLLVTTTTGKTTWYATVTDQRSTSTTTPVLSLQVPEADAVEIASLPAESLSLVVLPQEGR